MSVENYAQTEFRNPSAELKKYEGVWQWAENKDTLELVLKVDSLYKSQKYKDSSTEKLVLYGWHRYTENGRKIESDLDKTGNLKKFSILGSLMSADGTNYLGLMFYDIARDKYFKVFFKILNKEQSMAYWESKPQERSGGSGLLPEKEGGQTIPSPIILKKIAD